jgi:hypothetical protein
MHGTIQVDGLWEEMLGLLNGNLKWTRRNGTSGTATADPGSGQVAAIIIQLEHVDKTIREEIRREIADLNHDSCGSSQLACLMRSRADVQGAITSLLGASH